jgi:hypothetical protein
MVGFSIPRTFTLRSILPTLSFCAKPKAKSQNPHPKITLALRERGDCRRRWVRAREEHFLTLLIRPDGKLTPGRRLSLARGFNCQVQQMNDPRRIPESVFSFFHIRVKV